MLVQSNPLFEQDQVFPTKGVDPVKKYINDYKNRVGIAISDEAVDIMVNIIRSGRIKVTVQKTKATFYQSNDVVICVINMVHYKSYLDDDENVRDVGSFEADVYVCTLKERKQYAGGSKNQIHPQDIDYVREAESQIEKMIEPIGYYAPSGDFPAFCDPTFARNEIEKIAVLETLIVYVGHDIRCNKEHIEYFLNYGRRPSDYIPVTPLVQKSFDRKLAITKQDAFDYRYVRFSRKVGRIKDFQVCLDKNGSKYLKDEYGDEHDIVDEDRSTTGFIPSQTLGVCYFHSSLNAIINNRTFAEKFEKYLKDTATTLRPFDLEQKNNLRMTLSRQLSVKAGDDIETFFNATIDDGDLLKWAQTVVLYHAVRKGRVNRVASEKGSKSADVLAAGLLNNRGLNKKDTPYQKLQQAVEGGNVMQCIDSIFRSVGIKVYRPEYGLVVRLEGIRLLVIGSFSEIVPLEAFRQHIDVAKELRLDLGDGAGVFTLEEMVFRDGQAASEGHALCYVRGPGDDITVIDPNRRCTTLTEAEEKYASARLKAARYTRMFQLKDKASAKQDGGDEDESVESEQLGPLLMITPETVTDYDECDEERCSLPEDLELVMMLMPHIIDKVAPGLRVEEILSGGGSSAAPVAWVALSAIIMTMSFLGAM
jgi:hypothetical protein